MNNLYVFAIGGSGEQTLRSLVTLLMIGMPVGAKKIVPVIVDNDVNAKSLTECERLISLYNNTDTSNGGKLGLRATYDHSKLSELPSFAHVEIAKPVKLSPSGDNLNSLGHVIGAINLTNPVDNRLEAEKDLLYTHDDLNMPLNIGFVGNPNIGSVVLNSSSFQMDEFTNITAGITSNDGVMVVGSLFGGTGAAGIPMIVNKFFTDDPTKKALLGAITLLPYFETNKANRVDNHIINENKYDVSSETFQTKTRAALMYYADYMNALDYLYYVGDDNKMAYKHSVGGPTQANPMHLVEVMSALSIIDFTKQDRTGDVVYKRPKWGFKDDSNGTDSNIDGVLNQDLKTALVKFSIMKRMFECDDFIKIAIDNKAPYVKDLNFTTPQLLTVRGGQTGNAPCEVLHEIFSHWDYWITALKTGNRKFNFLNEQQMSTKNPLVGFYTEKNNNFGLAKTETKTEFTFSGINRIEVAKDANLGNHLNKAAKALNLNPGSIGANDSLPMLLLVISKALDEVIKESSIL